MLDRFKRQQQAAFARANSGGANAARIADCTWTNELTCNAMFTVPIVTPPLSLPRMRSSFSIRPSPP